MGRGVGEITLTSLASVKCTASGLWSEVRPCARKVQASTLPWAQQQKHEVCGSREVKGQATRAHCFGPHCKTENQVHSQIHLNVSPYRRILSMSLLGENLLVHRLQCLKELVKWD